MTVDSTTKRDVTGKTIVGPTKSQAGMRVVTLPDFAADIIEEHLDRYVPAAPEALFYTRRLGEFAPMDGREFLAALKKACGEAGVESSIFHDLRHSGMTLYGQAGATLAELMSRAGHSSVGSVMRYQHAIRERDAVLIDKMTGLE